jgi:hypothetical protein
LSETAQVVLQSVTLSQKNWLQAPFSAPSGSEKKQALKPAQLTMQLLKSIGDGGFATAGRRDKKNEMAIARYILIESNETLDLELKLQSLDPKISTIIAAAHILILALVIWNILRG